MLKKKETDEERRAREELEKENAITIEDFLETEVSISAYPPGKLTFSDTNWDGI